MEVALLIIGALLSVVGFFGVLILNDLRASIKEASKSIQKLNINIAIVVKTVEQHDERIKRLESTL